MSQSATIDREFVAESAKAQLWRLGRLEWKLWPHQLEIYRLLRDFKGRKLFLDCSRRYGKSFTLLLYSIEFAIQRPKMLIRFAAPTMADLEEIYHPMMDDICEDCPDDMRPVWRTTRGRGHYFFPSSGSRLYMFGTDNKNYRKGRGKALDLGVYDEAGAGDNCEKTVNEIMMPQTLGRGGRIFIATTPPDTPEHESKDLKDECEAAGNYICRTLDDNTHYSDEEKEEILREAGGRESHTAQREYFCKWIVNLLRAVLPEFTDNLARELTREHERPRYFHAIEAMDVGFSDYTVNLFGYYDFRAAILVIEDEVALRGTEVRTDKLAAAIKAKEALLWPDRKVYSRVSDTDLILLNDLASLHKLPFSPTAKDDKEAQVNEVRIWLGARRIVIHPRCEVLLRHMKGAIWNKQRTKFERTKRDGHFDAVDALTYLLRNCPINSNPYPAMPEGVTPQTHSIDRRKLKQETGNALALKQMFKR